MKQVFHGTPKNDSEGAPYNRLWGGDGHDALSIDVAGRGKLRGEAGDDILFIDPNIADARAILYGGGGSDTIRGGGLWDIGFGGPGGDYADGGAGSNSLYGDAGRDGLYGGAGDDYLYGGKGNDKGGIVAPSSFNAKGKPDYAAFDGGLYGGEGDDLLNGGAGSDVLYGGAGDDVLFGREGKDKLFGGDGGDVFLYWYLRDSKPGKPDIIFDFAAGDRINLEDIDVNHHKSGDQAFKFIGDDPFGGKAGQLRYSNGLLEGDVDGDKKADLSIKLANKTVLDADDIIL